MSNSYVNCLLQEYEEVMKRHGFSRIEIDSSPVPSFLDGTVYASVGFWKNNPQEEPNGAIVKDIKSFDLASGMNHHGIGFWSVGDLSKKIINNGYKEGTWINSDEKKQGRFYVGGNNEPELIELNGQEYLGINMGCYSTIREFLKRVPSQDLI